MDDPNDTSIANLSPSNAPLGRRRRRAPVVAAPPPTPKPEECIERVYHRLRLCHSLLTAPTPAALVSCAAVLNLIADDLEVVVQQAHSPGADLGHCRTRILEAYEELIHANNLAQLAGSFHQGWVRLLAPYLQGYTRSGAPAELTCEGQLLLQV